MVEEWRIIPSFPDYSASSDGRIKRITIGRMKNATVGRILKQRKGTHYMITDLSYKTMNVHILVAEAFVGLRPEGMQVNHKDGVMLNNHYSNLEYVTPKQNIHHAMRLGLFDNAGKKHPRGRAKLTWEKVDEIRLLLDEGKEIKDISSLYSVSYNTIHRIKRQRTWPIEDHP